MSVRVSQDCLVCGTRSRYVLGEGTPRDWPHSASSCSRECGDALVEVYGPEKDNEMVRAAMTSATERVDRIILAAITGEALDPP